MGIVLPLARQKRTAGTCISHYKGFFHATDARQYFSYPLIIPEGTQRLVISLTYTHDSGRNALGLQVFDQNGFRARGQTLESQRDWGRVETEIAADSYTRGVVAGEIIPGIWMAEIDTFAVGSCCSFELETEVHQCLPVSAKRPRQAVQQPPQPVLKLKPAWYRGDLHIHSNESDGTLEVRDLLRLGVLSGLDFMAITDHNVHTGWQYMPPELSEFCLPLRGIELSTYYGHGNALGISGWVDWRLGKGDYGVNDMIRQVWEQGGIFSINHPRTGKLASIHASWRAEGVDYNLVDAIEIWNAPVFSNGSGANWESRQFWNQLLNQGYRITGLGGSDAHYLGGSRQPLGVPLTYVYAPHLSEVGIITGIKRGNVFMTTGPEVFFTAAGQSGAKAMVGEELALRQPGEQVWLHVNIKGAPLGSEVRIVKNGTPCLSDQVSHARLFSIAWCDDEVFDTCGNRAWYRLELYAPCPEAAPGDDGLLAITNPIYVVS